MRNTLEIGEELIKKLEQCPQCGEPRLKHHCSDSIVCGNCGLRLRVYTYKDWLNNLVVATALSEIVIAFFVGLMLGSLRP